MTEDKPKRELGTGRRKTTIKKQQLYAPRTRTKGKAKYCNNRWDNGRLMSATQTLRRSWRCPRSRQVGAHLWISHLEPSYTDFLKQTN